MVRNGSWCAHNQHMHVPTNYHYINHQRHCHHHYNQYHHHQHHHRHRHHYRHHHRRWRHCIFIIYASCSSPRPTAIYRQYHMINVIRDSCSQMQNIHPKHNIHISPSATLTMLSSLATPPSYMQSSIVIFIITIIDDSDIKLLLPQLMCGDHFWQDFRIVNKNINIMMTKSVNNSM